MLDLLIIADDFTGAIDTGVQFAEAGVQTKVVTDVGYDFHHTPEEVRVIVIDTESRHLPKEQAYDTIYSLVERALKSGIPHIFKKTDSALRGNVGSELNAVLRASGEQVLPFIPAFPTMNRVTRNGRHYIDGELLENSVFSLDPFEPTTISYVPDILSGQCTAQGVVITKEMQKDDPDFAALCSKPYIAVFDCESDEQMLAIAKSLQKINNWHIMAGCAGLASVLPKVLCLASDHKTKITKKDSFFAICGSVNPITVRQLDFASEHGFTRHYLTPEQKLEENYWDRPEGQKELEDLIQTCAGETLCIIDSNDQPGRHDTAEYAAAHRMDTDTMRRRITESLGRLAKARMKIKPVPGMMIMGGDTLMGFFRMLSITEVTPIAELSPGTVLSEFTVQGETYQVISKSGGFGNPELLIDLADKMVVEAKDTEQYTA